MKNEEKLASLANRWTRTSVAVTLMVLLVSAISGFVLLPRLDPTQTVSGLWDSICRAAGRPVNRDNGPVEASDQKLSQVVLASAIPAAHDPSSIGRGATLAQQCAICHGPTGLSRADSPNLAGQYASVVYKQLKDFKEGARVNAVMTPFALNLSERDMHDLAAYYAYLPKLPGFHPGAGEPEPRIVVSGAPVRGIAPCGSCHGTIENKLGSPWLEGQSEQYLKAQLTAFANGTRHNDISQQMRNVARAMTPEEINLAARYYSSRQPTESAASE